MESVGQQEARLTVLVVAWIAWATMQIPNDWSWRSLALMQVFPAALQLVFLYCKHLPTCLCSVV